VEVSPLAGLGQPPTQLGRRPLEADQLVVDSLEQPAPALADIERIIAPEEVGGLPDGGRGVADAGGNRVVITAGGVRADRRRRVRARRDRQGLGPPKVEALRRADPRPPQRAARERRGWSREELAYRAGVSWSAIAQIESGRRKDVRLTSLTALAEALAVSVDYLAGSTAPPLLEHGAILYESDEELAAIAAAFLRGGDTHGRALAVTNRRCGRQLKKDLAEDAAHVDFGDAEEWYTAPATATKRFRAFIDESVVAGAAWVRVVAQPVWEGRTKAQVDEWIRAESLTNLTFASRPVTLLCSYDTSAAPARLVDGVRATHPELVTTSGREPSATYQLPEDFLLG
jgi:transcriptional regulator with XRE-family HTH domain